jgi:hypothetical protein
MGCDGNGPERSAQRVRDVFAKGVAISSGTTRQNCQAVYEFFLRVRSRIDA